MTSRSYKCFSHPLGLWSYSWDHKILAPLPTDSDVNHRYPRRKPFTKHKRILLVRFKYLENISIVQFFRQNKLPHKLEKGELHWHWPAKQVTEDWVVGKTNDILHHPKIWPKTKQIVDTKFYQVFFYSWWVIIKIFNRKIRQAELSYRSVCFLIRFWLNSQLFHSDLVIFYAQNLKESKIVLLRYLRGEFLGNNMVNKE